MVLNILDDHPRIEALCRRVQDQGPRLQAMPPSLDLTVAFPSGPNKGLANAPVDEGLSINRPQPREHPRRRRVWSRSRS